MHRIMSTTVALALTAGAASAQSWEFAFDHQTLSPENPSATVTLWATFDPGDWAFAAAWLDVHASEPAWSDPSFIIGWSPGQIPGTISPDAQTVERILVAQLWTFGRGPDPFNPIAVWQAVFTATDFSTPRDIVLSTETERFTVYPEPSRELSDRTPIDIEATIRVVPAPGVLAVAVLGASALGPRCRRRPSTFTPSADQGVNS